ncbi:hypothetical protein LCGC14_1710670 [marine sediment metagenome]|uniref:Uncharacterized protein n=1 Tax=marine sediment metagenome TaxID=412755 RepID=A0A0F9I2W8_9ZZZZ
MVTEGTKPCRCNTANRDPDCHIDHTLSAMEADMAFPGYFTIGHAEELYKVLDELLKGVGLLPLGQVTSRPVLHKAVDRGMEVLDKAVKEGRYVVPKA